MASSRARVLLLIPTLACSDPDPTGNDETEGESSESDAGTSSTSESSTTNTSDATDSTEAESESETGQPLEPVCDFDLPATITNLDLAAHLEALDAMAVVHGGTRVAGSLGYEGSGVYVEERLAAAGYTSSRWEFEFDRYELFATPVLAWANELSLVYQTDFDIPVWSPGGSVTANVSAVDLDLGLGNSSTSGCEPEDFAGFPIAAIALIQRGGCTFSTKSANAEAAGASGVLIFNQGHQDSESAMGLFGGTLGSTNDLTAPVALIPYALGEALADAAALDDVEVELDVDGGTVLTQTFNVFAERPGIGADAERVVMLGAHLDSVSAGPGVNDNGSGSSLVLTLAEQFAACNPRYTVRFAWWGAEEWGLVGSRQYVESLEPAEADRIALYLNFDMVASPNYVRFVHSGLGGPPGSTAIFDVFEVWFTAQDLPISPSPFAANSDYQPFVDAGIAAGGLATGAGGSKSQAEVDTWGGEVGAPYDSCYHQPCDTKANIAADAHEQNAKAAAWALAEWSGDLSGIDDARASAAGDQVAVVPAHSYHECGHPAE